MSSLYEVYEKAKKMGEACCKERKEDHQNPYLPDLDTLLAGSRIISERHLGNQEILTSHIAGTRHPSRTEAFAWNFMPLLEKDSEFAAKWMNLYHFAIEDGLRDPIKVYEVYGRYFVEEGNKRVSVMRYLDNPSILADVTELIVDIPEEYAESAKYAEYLKFYQATGISCILMSRARNYNRLLTLLKAGKNKILTPQERDDVLSLYYSFEAVLFSLKDLHMSATVGDAFLIFLEIYGYSGGKILSQNLLRQEIEKIIPDLEAYPRKKDAALLVQSESSSRKSMFGLLREFRVPLKVCFIESQSAETSVWSREHQDGIEYMKQKLKGAVQVQIYDQANTQEEIEESLKKAVAAGNEVIFTTNPVMLPLCNQYAARHPKIRFLNCSLNPETADVRTYYAREYEVQFLMGLAAGVLSGKEQIGYIADYPIYGRVADINAFALGVQMTRPHAQIVLDWSTTEAATQQDFPMDLDMLYVAGSEFDPRVQNGKKFGLFDVGNGRFFHLADVHVHWGIFYTQIVASVLNHTYRTDAVTADTDSINYWLGLSNGLLSIQFSEALPRESRRLINLVQEAMTNSSFFPFSGLLETQTGEKEEHSPLHLEELVKMDWLLSNIKGIIPHESSLTDEAEEIVRIHGMGASHEESEDENS